MEDSSQTEFCHNFTELGVLPVLGAGCQLGNDTLQAPQRGVQGEHSVTVATTTLTKHQLEPLKGGGGDVVIGELWLVVHVHIIHVYQTVNRHYLILGFYKQ